MGERSYSSAAGAGARGRMTQSGREPGGGHNLYFLNPAPPLGFRAYGAGRPDAGIPMAGHRGAVAMATLVVALLAYDLWRTREKAISAAFRETGNLTNVFEEYTARTFQAIDGVLSNLSVGSTKIDLQDRTAEPRLIGMLIEQLRNFPQVASFGVVDDTGTDDRQHPDALGSQPVIRRSRLLPHPSRQHVHRDLYRLVREQPHHRRMAVHRQPPSRAGRRKVRWRRVRDDRSSLFRGPVRIDRRRRKRRRHLLHRDGTILARSPRHDDFVGESIADDEFYRVHLQNADRGSARIRSAKRPA